MRTSFCTSALFGCWLSTIAFADASELPKSYDEVEALYDDGVMPSDDDFPLLDTLEGTRFYYNRPTTPVVGFSVGLKYGPKDKLYWAEGIPGYSAQVIRRSLLAAIKNYTVSRLAPSRADESFKRTDVATSATNSCIGESHYRKAVLEGGLEVIVHHLFGHGNCVTNIADPIYFGYFVPLAPGRLVEVTADADIVVDKKSVDKVTTGERHSVKEVKGNWVRLQKLDGEKKVLAGWVRVENLKQLKD